MEINELKYFLAAAKTENVNRAAEAINISPGSISKAIKRLEEELQTPLFDRIGRNIKLTPDGHLLKKRANQILQLEEDTRFEIKGEHSEVLNIYISSEEVHQSSFGMQIAHKINKLFPHARVHFLIQKEEHVIEQIKSNDAHLGLISVNPPTGIQNKALSKIEFVTCASERHPLLKKFKKSYDIQQVLEHPFVAPSTSLLGKISKSESLDGWRDDKFPRKIKYKAHSLKVMENLINEGLALGYLPDKYVETTDLKVLDVAGCPYSCEQSLKLIAKNPKSLGWLSKLWDHL